MLNPRAFNHLLFPDSLGSTCTEATGSGWSVTYDCFLFSANLHTLFPRSVGATNGFLIRLQFSHLLKPLYIPHSSSFFLDSSTQLLPLPPSYFSSYSSTLNFVLSILSHLGVPTSNPDPLARLIFSFTNRHHLSVTTSPVPLYISFTSTTVLRNHAEAADWVHGGTPDSQVVRTLRMTFESLRRLKDESLDGWCLKKSCCKEEGEEEEKCMVCLEGLEEETKTKRSVSRLSCSHVFHFQCVSQWLSLDHRCPICRSPMPWVHAFFPDADVDAPSSFSRNSTDYLNLDDDDDNDGHNLLDDSYYTSTAEPSRIFTKLGCFLKKIVQNMLIHLFSEDNVYSSIPP